MSNYIWHYPTNIVSSESTALLMVSTITTFILLLQKLTHLNGKRLSTALSTAVNYKISTIKQSVVPRAHTVKHIALNPTHCPHYLGLSPPFLCHRE